MRFVQLALGIGMTFSAYSITSVDIWCHWIVPGFHWRVPDTKALVGTHDGVEAVQVPKGTIDDKQTCLYGEKAYPSFHLFQIQNQLLNLVALTIPGKQFTQKNNKHCKKASRLPKAGTSYDCFEVHLPLGVFQSANPDAPRVPCVPWGEPNPPWSRLETYLKRLLRVTLAYTYTYIMHPYSLARSENIWKPKLCFSRTTGMISRKSTATSPTQ